MDRKAEKRELTVTLSVAAMVENMGGNKLLLVRDKETGLWGPPAGSLGWLEEGRMETFEEGIRAELEEETGLTAEDIENLYLSGTVNMPGRDKHRIGIIYNVGVKLTCDFDGLKSIENDEDVDATKWFNQDELINLLRSKEIRKPEFNVGLIMWWLRNEHRDNWDPYRGTDPMDGRNDLTERYLQYWHGRYTDGTLNSK